MRQKTTLLGISAAALFVLEPFGAALAAPLSLVSAADPNQAVSASAGGDSWSPVATPDGRFVVFASTANNLALLTNSKAMPEDVPWHQNVFLRDRKSGTTVLVSVNSLGTAGGNGNSTPVDVSTNGQYVLFESYASNLVAGDTNAAADVFVRDVANGKTLLISADTNGGFADGSSRGSVITPDGRYVAFVSEADNLVTGDTNGIPDIFVRDLKSNVTSLVSVGAAGALSGTSEAPLITPDGRYVAFYSTATNLVPDAVGSAEIYVRDLIQASTVWVSSYARTALAQSVSESKAVSYNHSLSADGKFVTYEASVKPSLVLTNPGPPGVILRFNTQNALTDVVNNDAAIPSGSLEDRRSLDMTPDGRYVAFIGNQVDISGDTTAVLVWDAQGGSLTLASGAPDQTVPEGSTCDSPVLDPTGRFVAFFSSAPGLTTNMSVGDYHLYLRDLQAQVTSPVDVDTNGAGSTMAPTTIPRLGAGAQWIAFENASGSLVPNDRNHAFDVFVRDVGSNSTELVSVHDPALTSQTATGSSALSSWGICADARYVAFSSEADDVTVGNDTNGCRDVFVRDTVFGYNILVSAGRVYSGSANGVSSEATMSFDGRIVAFSSTATNLVYGDTNGFQDVFVRDLHTGAMTLISVDSSGASSGNGYSFSPLVSGDGRFVLFRSRATNLAPGSFSAADNLFLRDLQKAKTYALTTSGFSAGEMTRDGLFVVVSSISGPMFVWSTSSASKVFSRSIPGGVSNVAISPDGNRLVYWTAAAPIQLVTIDRGNNTNWVVDTTLPASKSGLKFSSDGRLMAYAAGSTQGGPSQVYVYDFQAGGRTLVSHNQSRTGAGNGASDWPEISLDGRFVAYRSEASDLVTNDNNGEPDLFLCDLTTLSTTLLSEDPIGHSANNRSLAPVFAPDGRTLIFQSWASDLTANDFNRSDDLFSWRFLYAGITGGDGVAYGPSLSWPWEPGSSYRVEFKSSLDDASWTQATGSITNSGTRGYFQESKPVSKQRFYRIHAN